ncbi:toxin ParE1/3/4 [Novosphingobium chloroacetimidivorans]|uniref:Toxin ParE1/3/4 n=1 Tax=Novosphingobium chloroacetimidivorans TaxID=1428314 RepID=A0A7W7K732_9SPHN|nr:type II toxin-antitoxin system RelE/ParE family toxin [Novosphingobium chloroacetimidivorans]MBB4857459.1 toxin ParE1/3/4 [Novosphingobium chloroacetimidivorans]
MPGFLLSTEAFIDIDRLYENGVVTFGLSAADAYYEGLFATFDFLASYPHAARLRTEVDPPTRVYRYRSHLIVYDVGDRGEVIIQRIRHGREDWQGDVISH